MTSTDESQPLLASSSTESSSNPTPIVDQDQTVWVGMAVMVVAVAVVQMTTIAGAHHHLTHHVPPSLLQTMPPTTHGLNHNRPAVHGDLASGQAWAQPRQQDTPLERCKGTAGTSAQRGTESSTTTMTNQVPVRVIGSAGREIRVSGARMVRLDPPEAMVAAVGVAGVRRAAVPPQAVVGMRVQALEERLGDRFYSPARPGLDDSLCNKPSHESS
jgi:hypothetical protein